MVVYGGRGGRDDWGGRGGRSGTNILANHRQP